MPNTLKEAKVRRDDHTPAGTWIQITFTLDPEHYRTLWQRAEDEHRTIPALARESMIDFLGGMHITSRKIERVSALNVGDQS